MAYKLTYNNQGTRNLPLSEQVARIYELAAQAAGVDEIRVTSGGQPSSGPNRTGSHRHDAGGAGDIQLVKNGRVLEFTNPEDLPYFSNFVSAAKGGGLTGFGAGTDYMGNSTIHAGGGSSAVWGAGGSGKNAPDWLRQAYGTTLNSTPVTSTTLTGSSGDTPVDASAGVAAKPEDPYAAAISDLEEIIKPNKQTPQPEAPPPSGPSLQPNAPNPQMAQSIMQMLLNRNKPSLMSGFGIT